VSGSAIHTPQQLQLTTPPQCASLLYRCLAVAACSRQPLDCPAINTTSIASFSSKNWKNDRQRDGCAAHTICPFVCPSIRLSHGCINRKWLKLVLYNFHLRQSHPSTCSFCRINYLQKFCQVPSECRRTITASCVNVSNTVWDAFGSQAVQ